MSVLEQFRKQNSPMGNVSALSPYTDNILALKKEGYSNAQVWEYLKIEGVDLSLSSVNKFIAAVNKRKKLQEIKPQASLSISEKVPTMFDELPSPEEKATQLESVKRVKTIEDINREKEARKFHADPRKAYIAPSWCIDKTPVEELMAPAKKK